MNDIKQQLFDIASSKIDDIASLLAKTINYQIVLTQVENTLTNGEVSLYDAEHAELYESFLLQHLEDVFYAKVEKKESAKNVISRNIVLQGPDNMTITDKVMESLTKAMSNAKKLLGYGGDDNAVSMDK